MSRAGLSTPPLHVVVGAGGQVGRALVAELGTRGLRVRAVGRSLDANRFPGAEVALGDIGDEHAAARLCDGATVVYGCFGAPYGEWKETFPRMARGLLPARLERMYVDGSLKPSDADAKYSVAATAILGLLAYANAAKIPTEGLLSSVGLTPEALKGPEARVSHGANNKVWAALAERSGDAEFGLHFAERLDADTLDVVGHLVARSATFGEGLERVVAYSRILHDAGRVEMERAGPHVIIYPGCRGFPIDCPRHVAEFSAAIVLVLGRSLTGAPIVPIEVRFKHAAPPRLREHLRFFAVTPSFDAQETAVILEAAVLDLPIRDPQPGILTYLDAYARDVVAKLPDNEDILDQVERIIAQSLSRGVPDTDQVAKALGLHPRTLQRRLAESETTFQALVDGVRRSYAERYLSDDRLALAEIAFLVGFSDPSNFHRAFRRWVGTTPAAFRDASRAQAADTAGSTTLGASSPLKNCCAPRIVGRPPSKSERIPRSGSLASGRSQRFSTGC